MAERNSCNKKQQMKFQRHKEFFFSFNGKRFFNLKTNLKNKSPRDVMCKGEPNLTYQKTDCFRLAFSHYDIIFITLRKLSKIL